MRSTLGLAALTTAALVGATLVVRALGPFGAPPPTASDVVPHLWGIGAVVVVVLTHAWAPSIAWSAAVVGATAAAMADVGLARSVRATYGDRGDPALDGLVAVALVIPLAVAAGYATSEGRPSRAVSLAAWGTVALLATVLAVNWARRVLWAETGGIPQWVWLGAVAVVAGFGLARDLRPAFVRTRARLAADGAGRDGPGALSMLRVLVEELAPGREAARVEAAESERGRIAADLHAEVLPSLRRALAEAEAGGTVERLAADLRAAVDEVESLLVARRSIVLEEMGLLAGVEWLAERVEERSDVRVEIEVRGEAAAGDGGMAGRPPRDVERAAFRVAQLALDNVIRHAPGAAVTLPLAVRPDAVDLEVVDDGPGPPSDEAAAARAGRRGMADMRAEARSCGASAEIGRGTEGRGTAVRFHWRA